MVDSFTSPHVLYTFSGNLPGGEVWSCGLRTVAATPVEADMDHVVQSADAAFRTWWNSATYGGKTFNTPTVSYEGCTARAVSTAGITTAQADFYPVSAPGAQAAQTAPQQSALVVTLLTAKAGRSGKGRIYLPILAPLYESFTGRITAQQQTGIAVSVALLVTNLNTFSGGDPGSAGPWAIAVQSRVSGQPAPAVNGVRVGNVIDTQRRRRDKLVENYSTVAITP